MYDVLIKKHRTQQSCAVEYSLRVLLVLFVYLLCVCFNLVCIFFFFFNDTATTEIYTLSLHDALPITPRDTFCLSRSGLRTFCKELSVDRKSTRLNSSHSSISYAVFCLKKKKKYQSHNLNKKKKKKKKHKIKLSTTT